MVGTIARSISPRSASATTTSSSRPTIFRSRSKRTRVQAGSVNTSRPSSRVGHASPRVAPVVGDDRPAQVAGAVPAAPRQSSPARSRTAGAGRRARTSTPPSTAAAKLSSMLPAPDPVGALATMRSIRGRCLGSPRNPCYRVSGTLRRRIAAGLLIVGVIVAVLAIKDIRLSDPATEEDGTGHGRRSSAPPPDGDFDHAIPPAHQRRARGAAVSTAQRLQADEPPACTKILDVLAPVFKASRSASGCISVGATASAGSRRGTGSAAPRLARARCCCSPRTESDASATPASSCAARSRCPS